MVARGRVENGVIVLEPGVTLPEGIVVTILPESPYQENKPVRSLNGNSVLDIPTYSFGETLRPLSEDDDILGEMLEGRS